MLIEKDSVAGVPSKKDREATLSGRVCDSGASVGVLDLASCVVGTMVDYNCDSSPQDEGFLCFSRETSVLCFARAAQLRQEDREKTHTYLLRHT